uniref:Uncharacterized protein n=1 Tax=Panagrolaimus superbus TaxID=310955 RepID=A0A914Z8B8_9BILA
MDLKLKLTTTTTPSTISTTPIPTIPPSTPTTTLKPVLESEPTTLTPILAAPTTPPILTDSLIIVVSTPAPPLPSTPEMDTSMLLNLRPPAEFLSKNKKRNVVEAEVVETNFRTNRQSRRSSGTSQTKNAEEFETEFKKPSLKVKKENYEKYDTPHIKVSKN